MAKAKKAKKTVRIIELGNDKKQIDGGTLKVEMNKVKRTSTNKEKVVRVKELNEQKPSKSKKGVFILRNNIKHNGITFKKGTELNKESCDFDVLKNFC